MARASAVAIGLVAVALAAEAGDRVTSRVDVYRDPWMTAWVPQVFAERVGDRWAARGGVAVDVVSGATLTLGPDVVSSATWFDDRRWQADLSYDRVSADGTVGFGVATSVESDYATWAPSLSVTRELRDETITLSARYAASVERQTTSTGEPVRQRTIGHALDLGWRQILDRRTAISLSAGTGWLACGEAIGCVASPYRFVPFVDESGIAFAVAERHPAARGRLAGAARVSRSVGPAAVHVDGGAYADTWGMTGGHAGLALAGEALQDRLLLSSHARVAAQSAVAFWRDAYATDGDNPTFTPFRTVDSELGGVRDLALGGRVEWSFHDVGPLLRLGVSARGDRLWFRYAGVSARAERDVWIFGGGVDAEF